MNDNEPWIKLLRCQTFVVVVVNFKATKKNKSISTETHKLHEIKPVGLSQLSRQLTQSLRRAAGARMIYLDLLLLMEAGGLSSSGRKKASINLHTCYVDI